MVRHYLVIKWRQAGFRGTNIHSFSVERRQILALIYAAVFTSLSLGAGDWTTFMTGASGPIILQVPKAFPNSSHRLTDSPLLGVVLRHPKITKYVNASFAVFFRTYAVITIVLESINYLPSGAYDTLDWLNFLPFFH